MTIRSGRVAASCSFCAPNGFAISQSGPSRLTKCGKIGVCGTPKPATIWAMDYAPLVVIASHHWLADFVDLHCAHALIVDLGVQPADLEAGQVVHQEAVGAHTVELPDVAVQ